MPPGAPPESPPDRLGIRNGIEQVAAAPKIVRLRGGFAIAEWFTLGLGNSIAALGLGLITGSLAVGILIGIALLAVTWTVLLWI